MNDTMLSGVASAVPDADPTVLEPAALAKLAELDPQGRNGLVRKVLQTYLQSLRGARATVAEAAGRGDAAAVGMAAHTLKSASACVGAGRLAGCCAATERATREAGADDWLAQQRLLLEEAARVEAELDRCLGPHTSTCPP